MTSPVDARLVEALREQLRRRPRDAERVGWKVGAGERERIGDSIAVGNLTEPGDRVITGSIVQVPVASGDDVLADLGSLGRVGLAIA